MTDRLVCLGECMVELAETGPATYRRSFAGDTFNAAWYARRALPEGWDVAYATCIGTDAVSDEMAAFMAGEGIATDTLRRIPERGVGLYMIALKDGERSFAYWRGQSAARLLADDPDWLDAVLGGAAHVHVSGITLAILAPEARRHLIDALARARTAGVTVSLDTNIRPRLWENDESCRAALTACAEASDVLLPSFDEEAVLFGDATPEATLARYRQAGARVVVVKNGAAQILGWSDPAGEVRVDAVPDTAVVDTTAAGDSFAGAFLAAHLTGADLRAAITRAARVAAGVVGAHGALVR
ncbi:2-keto-3-deoxygluconate kinase [Roseivivax marinus]|uniref:sugar kinase n=1 Tax=Roseivivax marinus TaxID=1379903 RepID=UPI0008B45B3F|nr:sugar kinase [Roseivivax marinus]SEL75548.1 2-keto-3-deoxygluconate kinase [Roseivivax marinus]